MSNNVTKLAIQFAAKRAIPDGGGLVDALNWLRDADRRKQDLELSHRDALAAIAAVKAAPDNPWGDDDEAIAGAILDEIERRSRLYLKQDHL